MLAYGVHAALFSWLSCRQQLQQVLAVCLQDHLLLLLLPVLLLVKHLLRLVGDSAAAHWVVAAAAVAAVVAAELAGAAWLACWEARTFGKNTAHNTALSADPDMHFIRGGHHDSGCGMACPQTAVPYAYFQCCWQYASSTCLSLWHCCNSAIACLLREAAVNSTAQRQCSIMWRHHYSPLQLFYGVGDVCKRLLHVQPFKHVQAGLPGFEGICRYQIEVGGRKLLHGAAVDILCVDVVVL